MTIEDSKHADIDEIRRQIAGLTGKTPKSRDLDYLARKLAELRKRRRDASKAEDRHAERSTDDPSEVLSVSMPRSAKLATIRIAGGELVGVSELVRRAVGEYAAKRGYKAELVNFDGGES